LLGQALNYKPSIPASSIAGTTNVHHSIWPYNVSIHRFFSVGISEEITLVLYNKENLSSTQ
jgi:hypothetical protein